jgi:H+/Cl- antiporter ClcA
MGLQYFEALSPATISSIVAVLVNRIATGNDVTGYFSYPFLSSSLPSAIFTSAIVYGVYGAVVGTFYVWLCKLLKDWVHNLFTNAIPDTDADGGRLPTYNSEDFGSAEADPLISSTKRASHFRKTVKFANFIKRYFCIVIPNERIRTAVAGAIAGCLVGIIGIFVPHVMFWGEAQLQSLIDKGRTPLPVFGTGSSPTATMTSLGRCMIHPNDPEATSAGFHLGCVALISTAKIVTTGLSLGTGIIGGHFWGPLFVGCAAGHFFTDLINLIEGRFGVGGNLAVYPCVVILCTMGATHVVTFRAHMAIMLILTLTISTFTNDDSSAMVGDYSAVFPLLVVSVFMSLMLTRKTVFYSTQRSRGDITAVPEVLCQPGMPGRPLVFEYDSESDNGNDGSTDNDSAAKRFDDCVDASFSSTQHRSPATHVKEDSIEKDLVAHSCLLQSVTKSLGADPIVIPSPHADRWQGRDVGRKQVSSLSAESCSRQHSPDAPATANVSRLDELLNILVADMSYPLPSSTHHVQLNSHRRTQSAPIIAPFVLNENMVSALPYFDDLDIRFGSEGRRVLPSSSESGSGYRGSADSAGSFVRISTFGEVQEPQLSLMDQARRSAATSDRGSCHHGGQSFHNKSQRCISSQGPPPHFVHDLQTLTLQFK